MVLNIDIIDYYTKKKINNDFTIINNESTQQIKEKIFAFYSLELWIPELMMIINDNKILTNESANIFVDNKLYVRNLITDLKISKKYLEYFKRIDSDEDFELIINHYREKGYQNLNKNLMKIILKYLVDFEKYKDEIQTYFSSILEKQKKFLEKWKKIDNILDKVYALENFSEKFDKTGTGTGTGMGTGTGTGNLTEIDKVLYLQMEFIPKIDITKKNFDLFKLFNSFTLSEKYISTIINGFYQKRKEPIIKIHNKLPNNLEKSDIKEWVINEKKKTGALYYKKIKGVQVKVVKDDILYEIVINSNGKIIVSFDSIFKINQYVELKYEQVILNLTNVYTELVDYINNLPNLFDLYNFSQTLNVNPVNWTLKILNLSYEIEYNQRIAKEAFGDFVIQKSVKNNLFSLKDTKSKDPISLFYTKNIQNDTKGITVNIKDNPYKKNSSLITVFNCFNLVHFNIIASSIILIDYYNKINKLDKNEEPQKIKQKSTIKDLKKAGAEIISTNCQKPRQPIVDNVSKPLKDSYDLVWMNKRYVCPKKNYKYPGFTNQNIVCCFSKDKRRTDRYISNMKSVEFEIIVQASNYPIKIKEGKREIETFVIKLVSGPDSLSLNEYPFFYLDFVNNSDRLELVPIENKNLIEKILKLETENNIWLQPVQLSRIITPAPKNKCNKSSNMNSGSLNFCAHHKLHKYFGFNQDSFPCCFDKERPLFVKADTNSKKSQFFKKHVLKNDKILDIDRLGVLPGFLELILNNLQNFLKKSSTKMVKNSNEKYYRIGTIQGKDSFLNCVFFALKNSNDNKFKFNSVNEMKKIIVEKIKSKDIYNKIYNGQILVQQQYNTPDDFYKDFLSNYINYEIIISILFLVFDLNLYIFDINEDDSKKSFIICHQNYNPNYDSIILLKRNLVKINSDLPIFELVIKYNSDDDKSFTRFDKNNEFVNFCQKFLEKNCKIIYNYPKLFKKQFNKIIRLEQFPIEDVKYTYSNGFGKINWIVLKSLPKLLLPIYETIPLNEIKTVKFDFDSNTKKTSFPLQSLEKTIEDLTKLNKLYNLNIKKLNVVKSDEFFDGLLLNNSLIIPIKKEQGQVQDKVNFYYPELYTLSKFDFVSNDKLNFDSHHQHFYNFKKKVSEKIINNPDKKTEMEKIVKDTYLTNSSKFKLLYDILNDLDIPKSNIFTKILINEIIYDTQKMGILNGIISIYKISSNNQISKNENENLIINIKDFVNYIKK